MIGPFPLSAVLDRIAEIDAVRLSGTAADLEAALKTPPRATPAVYVLADEAGRGVLGSTGRTVQDIDVTVKIVIWVRNAGGPAAIVTEMGAVESALRGSLFGWRPAPPVKPLTIRASGNEQAYGQHLIRQLLLNTGYPQTTEPDP